MNYDVASLCCCIVLCICHLSLSTLAWNLITQPRCLFEAFISIISKAQVQMCFAPADEQGFFDALGAGLFDAKALCSTIDAMKATASVAEDKTMIMMVSIYIYSLYFRLYYL